VDVFARSETTGMIHGDHRCLLVLFGRTARDSKPIGTEEMTMRLQTVAAFTASTQLTLSTMEMFTKTIIVV
jgi:hypothetical protein